MITAIFDGHCVICQMTRQTVNTLDWFKRVEFLDLHQHQVVADRFPMLDSDALMGEIHVVTKDARIYAGFDGTKRILRDLPVGFPFWLLLQLPGMTWVGKRVYRFIAKHRYRINKWLGVELAPCVDGTCKIPQ